MTSIPACDGRRRSTEARDATLGVRMVWLRRFLAGEISLAALEGELERIAREGLRREVPS